MNRQMETSIFKFVSIYYQFSAIYSRYINFLLFIILRPVEVDEELELALIVYINGRYRISMFKILFSF